LGGIVEDRTRVEVRLLRHDEVDLLASVFGLAERHKKWLGVLSPAVYEENAAAGRILVAVDRDQLLGYAMFYVARRRVRLAHLCVEPAERQHGVARLLVNELSRLHASQDGISLRCRRDWSASKAWPKLGFEVRSNRPGRSRAGHLLTAWWRDHGHPDLFSSLGQEAPRMVVAMDTNVFRDVHERDRGQGAAQSRSLTAEWLEEEIELVVTPGLTLELNQIPDVKVREALLGTAQSGFYRMVGRPPANGQNPADALEQAIVAGIPDEILVLDPSLRADARMLAEAECGGADAFVTRDDNAVEYLTTAAAPFTDIWVSSPTDLIVHLDEVRDAVSYSPVRLRDTGYTVGDAEARTDADLRPLLNNAASETAVEFRALVRAAAQSVGDSGTRRVVRDPDGEVVAGAFFTRSPGEVAVSLLRVCDTKLAKTLANHLLHLLRTEAVEHGASRIVVRDPHVSSAVREALDAGGFRTDGEHWVVDVIRGVLTWREVVEHLPAVDQPVSAISVQTAADLERVHWPLKIRDSGLPCFLVPIRPAPASLLFGREHALWDADAELGLSRQHVYYRSPRPAVLKAPGRVLWYVSGNDGGVIAASRIDQVQIAHPGTLFRRFRRLGVLGVKAISDRAQGGVAMAVRFGDTEFFDRPVPLSRLRAMNSRLVPLASPRRVDEDHFFQVYEEGQAP
jgi:GNAT superfamily N-acetyltransferase